MTDHLNINFDNSAEIQNYKKHKYLIQSILDSQPNGIVVIDKDGIIRYRNKSWEEFQQSYCSDFQDANKYIDIFKSIKGISEKKAKELENTISSLKGEDNKGAYTMNYSCILNGEVKWFKLTINKYIGITPFTKVIVNTDITREKKLNDNYDTILNNIPEIITHFNKELNLNFINSAFAKHFGYDSDMLFNGNAAHDLSEDIIGLWRDKLDLVFKNRERKDFEYCFNINDETHYFQTRLIPTHLDEDKENKSSSILGITEDITKKKELQHQLEEQKANMQQLFDNSPLAVVLLNYNNEVLKLNNSFTQLFGYKYEELKNLNYFNTIVPEEIIVSNLEEIDQVSIGREIYLESKRLKKNGTEIEVSVTAFPVLLKENKIGKYIIYEDISERKENERLQNEFSNALIDSLIKVLELHDEYTSGHSYRVAELAGQIAMDMNLAEKEIDNCYKAALLHDIGKILIPKEILHKEGKLTLEEYAIVKKHPIFAWEILKTSKYLDQIALYVKHHHESWEDIGYPDNLKKDSIPLISQIIRVADIWDSLLSDRSYRSAHNKDKAREIMLENSGKAFSLNLLKVFLKILDKNQEEG